MQLLFTCSRCLSAFDDLLHAAFIAARDVLLILGKPRAFNGLSILPWAWLQIIANMQSTRGCGSFPLTW